MNQVETNQVAETTGEKQTAKYLVQRSKRTRFSFGNAWLNAVLAGVVNDKDKLVAHGVKLKIGSQRELSKMKLDTILTKVQNAVLSSTAQ